MSRVKELAFRTANAGLIHALQWLHSRFDVPTTYKLGPEGAAALFEGCWFTYRPREFGCTGNIDWFPDAENSTRHFLFDRMKDGQVFYDIGAHGGVYTITALARFPELIVHSFEPQSDDLRANLALNGIKSNLHEVAVGEEFGTVLMTTKERSSNHVSDSGDRPVSMVRLDDYAREYGLDLPDWIKIDIEGLELPALRGAEWLLRKARPTIICEINHISVRYGSTVAELIEYLGSLGYRIHALVDGELERVDEPLPYSANWNYWFIHRLPRR